MRNRCILFLLILSVFAAPCAVLADVDDVPERGWILGNSAAGAELSQNELANYTLLKYLGVITEPEDKFAAGDTVLRGYAASAAARLSAGELYTAKDKPYSDCPLTNEFADGVYTAKVLGISEDTAKFNPMKKIAPKDAAVFIVKALRLERAYPYKTAAQIAEDIGIYNGVDLTKSELTKGGFMVMTVNALNANAIDEGQKNGVYGFWENEDETILEKEKNIVTLKGIVTADAAASLFEKEVLGEGKIEINRTLYNIGFSSGENLAGSSIIAYADSEKDNFIIYAVQDKRLNTVWDIDAGDIDALEKTSVTYYDKGRRKIKIDDSAKVIYNGVYFGSYSQFDGKYDSIKFIDNDGDGSIDVLSVSKYSYYLADSISGYSKKIGMYENDAVLSFDESVCGNYEVYINGEKSDFSNIKKNDCLSVLEAALSDGKANYKVIVTRDTVEGKMDYEEVEDGKTYYSVSGVKYPLSDEYKRYLETNVSDAKPASREEFTFYISFDGKIVMSKRNVNEFSYAYYLKGYYLDEDESAVIRVYMQNGEFEEFTLADRVKLYNEDNLKGTKTEKERVIGYLDSKCGMIAYKLDSSGSVSDLAFEYNAVGKVPGTLDYPIIKNAEVGGGGVKTEEGRLYFKVLGCGYYLPTQTSVITVPSDKSKYDNIKNFNVGNASFSNDIYFESEKLAVYNASRFYQASICVLTTENGVEMDRFLRAYMISGVRSTVNDDDEACIELEYTDEKGNLKRETVCADATVSKPQSGEFYGVHGGIGDLKKGDIVQLNSSPAGITSVRILMKADNIGSYRTECQNDSVVSDLNGEVPFKQLGIMYGKVLDVDASAIVMNVSPSGDDSFTSMVRLDNNTAYESCTYTLFEKKSNKVTAVDNDELSKGDEVFLRKRYHHAIDIFIIRD